MNFIKGTLSNIKKQVQQKTWFNIDWSISYLAVNVLPCDKILQYWHETVKFCHAVAIPWQNIFKCSIFTQGLNLWWATIRWSDWSQRLWQIIKSLILKPIFDIIIASHRIGIRKKCNSNRIYLTNSAKQSFLWSEFTHIRFSYTARLTSQLI